MEDFETMGLDPRTVIAPGSMEAAIERADGKTLPLTAGMDGKQIGTAIVRATDDGMEVEATVWDEFKDQYTNAEALSVSTDGVRVVDMQEEITELGHLSDLLGALKGSNNRIGVSVGPRSEKPKVNFKEKTLKRAANKRARKSRKGNR